MKLGKLFKQNPFYEEIQLITAAARNRAIEVKGEVTPKMLEWVRGEIRKAAALGERRVSLRLEEQRMAWPHAAPFTDNQVSDVRADIARTLLKEGFVTVDDNFMGSGHLLVKW